MAGETKEKNIIFLTIFVALFIGLLFLFVVFLEQNYWWILPALFYFVFFVFREGNLKIKEINNSLIVKDRREIRIDFWG